ncbi:MAG: RrF2 family transcriptional regulator [Oscillospiraceae bacterium]|nr:RrF2 family transcriptional regulator [Oscillospiraceae bacterium]
MLVSTKGRYALKVMIDLAQHNDGEYVVLMDIARRQDISEKYLEGIISQLSRSGMLDAQRGRGGGYRLSRNPEEYTVGEIIRQTEGPLAPVACLKNDDNDCPRAADCLTLPLWEELDRRMNDYLDGITLSDLLVGNV